MRRFNYIHSARPPFFSRRLKSSPTRLRSLMAIATLTAVVLAFGWLPQKWDETVRGNERAQTIRGTRPSSFTATPAKSAVVRRSLPRSHIRPAAIPLHRVRRLSSFTSPMHRSAIAAAPIRERVVGVAVGERAQAIISLGDRTRIVTVGDVVAGRKIVTIGLDGLRFKDGSLRRVAITQR